MAPAAAAGPWFSQMDGTMSPIVQNRSRVIRILLICWLLMLGIDFFLHAGLLAGLYTRASPFLLDPLRAFRLIPLGYLAFLLQAVLLIWLMLRIGITGWRPGLRFGLILGLLIWGSLTLGLASIATADWDLLFAWWVGQSVELGFAGAAAGYGLEAVRFSRLFWTVIATVLLLVAITVLLQSLGYAPAAGL